MFILIDFSRKILYCYHVIVASLLLQKQQNTCLEI